MVTPPDRRDLCAYAPDPDPPLIWQAFGWAVTRPGQLVFALALFAGALWSLSA